MRRCGIVSARNEPSGVMIEFKCGATIEAKKHSRWREWEYCPFCGGALNEFCKGRELEKRVWRLERQIEEMRGNKDE